MFFDKTNDVSGGFSNGIRRHAVSVSSKVVLMLVLMFIFIFINLNMKRKMKNTKKPITYKTRLSDESPSVHEYRFVSRLLCMNKSVWELCSL